MNYNATPPNAIIFRLPDDDDDTPVFARVGLDEDGQLDSVGSIFTMHPDDEYNEMPFDQLRFVNCFDGGAVDLATFQMISGDEPVVINEIVNELQPAIQQLLQDYYSTPSTLQ